ncbi:hypothetical protein E4633_11995 [Geomonas terrae]|uniref:Uncharacterized protein n=1 Tax=Geomonas terrae TaxID=2562681 RepID=A0A4S1CD00_9BACT|nr:hypothetical protein [Geomonas terrae]TGU71063.1 hypothetical protein E4633_11995 [Geomonas terrae]
MVDREYALQFLAALLVTQLSELPVVWYLLSRHVAGEHLGAVRIATACFFANMATLPYLWFVYPEIFPYRVAITLGEATALFAEALLYMIMLRVSLRSAFFCSLVANVFSVLVGLIIMPPFP